MRLKFLFFPLMLVISLLVIALYIWPEMGVVKAAKTTLAESAKTLNKIKENQANIRSISADLTANKEKADFITAYFPQTKNEEKIVDALNYLATGAGLSVVSIGFSKDLALASQPEPVAQGAPMTSLATQGGAPVDPSALATSAVAPAPVGLSINKAVAQVTVVGEYEKILMYFDQVQKMGMYSALDKLVIAPQKNEGEDAGGSSALLSAQAEVNFAYAPAIKNATFEGSSYAGPRFDFAPVDKLRDLIAGAGVPASMPQIQIGVAGKTNPFLP